jgi:hypothetical protein
VTNEQALLAAFSALGAQLVEERSRAEVATHKQADAMAKVCSLECELDELKAKINTAHLMMAGASANGTRVASWANSLREILK